MADGRRRWIAVVVILIAAVAVRAWKWPGRYQVGSDEAGYLCSSLVLVEGITPGYKPAPAGPQIWLGWAWTQGHVAGDFLFPDANVAKAGMQVRPFLAMNEALFSIYRDLSSMRQFMLVVNVALLLAAVWGAFGYGHLRGGVAGGIVAAGLLAVAPLFVDFSLVSRPYSMAWSLGILAMYAAAGKSVGRAVLGGILLGMAVGSRVEMVLLLPLAWWEVWNLRRGLVLTGITLLTAYVVAPWLVTGLAGNLRAIATIGVANPMAAGETARSALIDFAWTNGFGLAAILFLAGIPFMLAGQEEGRRDGARQGVFAALVILIGATMFKSSGYGLRHHGGAVLPLVLGAAWGVGALSRRWPRMTWIAVAAALALPLWQTARTGGGAAAVSEAQWVEAHVPAGTVVYIDSGLLKAPLPTAAAADAIWAEVTGPDAWRKKFAAGLSRFGVKAEQMPRAMSEENLVQDRGSFRRWFILGSDVGGEGPRYDVRLIHPSPIFGVQIADIAGDFASSGGVVMWRTADYGAPPTAWGAAAAHLPDADGADVLVFTSGDVRLAD